ncbi:MAG TPA: SagB/ThcOx family dehydrogenase [Candidatus Binataceae bacterium]
MGNDRIQAAQVYHEITKHSYASVRTAPNYLDWDIKPLPYKIYPDAAAVALSRDLALPATPTLSALSSSPLLSAVTLGIPELTTLLFCANGLTRKKRMDGEDYHFRAAPSAGALYPIEIYLAAGHVDDLEAGLYHFSPADLKLRGLRRGDWRQLIARAAADRPSLLNCDAVLILSSIFWRSAWKYRARAYRYCFWDAGTMLANLLAAASSETIPVDVITAFSDPEMESLLGIDGEREGAVALIALGGAAHQIAEPPELTPMRFEAIALSSREVAYPDLQKIQSESRLIGTDQVRKVADAPVELAISPVSQHALKFAGVPADHGLRLGETILRRGSTRAFAQEPMPSDELATIMRVSSGHPRCDFSRLTDTYLIVNAIEGLEPGAYHYNREAEAFELLKRGKFRGEAGYLCLEQPLGLDCSALVVYMSSLERVLNSLGNRGYRDAHLEAGILGGRAYLAAYALGRGATGLTFYDDDTTRFFEPQTASGSPILMVALGVPLSKASS